MKTAISTRALLRLAIFVAIFMAVMSVSFLVEARDLPENVKVHAADTAVRDNTEPDAFFPLDDVTDGLASWYGREFHGRRTASGKKFNMNEFTAAHRNLPFGSLIRVVNPTTGRAVVVEVTDRGPFIRKRVVDLSYAAAQRIGITVTPVEMLALTPRAIEEFYCDNDSTALVIDAAMFVRVVPTSKLAMTAESSSLTAALSKRDTNDLIVILPPASGSASARSKTVRSARYATAERITSSVPDVAIR